MAAATLPFSETMRIPLSNRQDMNEFGAGDKSSNYTGGIADDWGPSSVPPAGNHNIPWDDQVVPALRKKLEQESKDITKRISRIETSQHGWSPSTARARDPIPPYMRDSQDTSRRMSREVVQHHRESSIDQYHNRFASVRTPSRTKGDIAASSFPFDSPSSGQQGSPGSRSSVVYSEATQRAREKARQIAARKEAQLNGSTDSMASSSETPWARASRLGPESSIDAIPEGEPAVNAAANGSSFERKRLRTQSTPQRPSDDVVNAARAAAEAEERNQAYQNLPSGSTPTKGSSNGPQRTASLSRRKAAAAAVMDPKLMEEFGPLGSTPSPAATSKLMQAHLEADPTSSVTSPMRKRQPDAFRSLASPDKGIRGYRNVSAPAGTGNVGDFGTSPSSKGVNSWEDQIIPTVARKLQQEQFLKAGDGRMSKYEGLIDTWDRNGLPLSHTDVMLQAQAQQSARKLQEQQPQEAQQVGPEGDGQMLQPGRRADGGSSSPVSRRSHLGPVEETVDRASSRRSQRSNRSQQQQAQQHQAIPMQQIHSQQAAQPTQQQPVPASPTVQAAAPRPAQPNRHDDVEKSGCCCIIM